MTLVTFNEEQCKECELCVAFCPKEVITFSERLNSKGFHPATIVDMDKCTGCAVCAKMCPDVVIEVERREVQ